MTKSEYFQIRISPEDKARLNRLAGRRTLDTGRRVSAAETLRELVAQALQGQPVMVHDPSGHAKRMEIQLPDALARSLRTASERSGQKPDDIIASALAEAFSTQEAA